MDANMNLNTSENQIIRSLAFMGGKGTLRHLQDVTIELSVSITILRSRKLITGDNYHYQLTDAGREYAIANGWLTAPANSEPQADITPADRAAVEAMGEVAANVFGGDTHCEKCGKPIYPRSGMCPACFSAWLHTVPAIDTDTTPNVLDVPASDEISKQDAQPEGVDVGAKTCVVCDGSGAIWNINYGYVPCEPCKGTGIEDTAIAQTAPVDGGSDELPTTDWRHAWNKRHIKAALEAEFKTVPQEIIASMHATIERQQAEIRALESKLAAAAAALEAIANLQPYTASQVLNKAWAVGHNRGLGKAQEIAKETLADRLGWKV